MRILAMAGSTRRDSFNRKLLAVGVKAAEAAGAEVEVIDLKELAIPLYDGDLEKEQGLPPGAQRLKDALAEAQGLLIATPENNHSIPAVLKNAIDWASRPPSNALAGKTAALMAASTGGFGGVRVLMQLRIPMHTLGVWVVPAHVMIARAAEAFDEAGNLRDPEATKQVEGLVKRLVDALSAN